MIARSDSVDTHTVWAKPMSENAGQAENTGLACGVGWHTCIGEIAQHRSNRDHRTFAFLELRICGHGEAENTVQIDVHDIVEHVILPFCRVARDTLRVDQHVDPCLLLHERNGIVIAAYVEFIELNALIGIVFLSLFDLGDRATAGSNRSTKRCKSARHFKTDTTRCTRNQNTLACKQVFGKRRNNFLHDNLPINAR
ncbi:hypothetical protein D3C80_1544190 [compost metagenome]